MTEIATLFTELTSLLADSETRAASFVSLSDEALIATHQRIAEHLREAEKYAALSAGEIARRSDKQLGQAGLAWRAGHVSAEAMVQKLSGISRSAAGRMVAVGTMIAEAEASANLEQQASEHPDDPELARLAGEDKPWHTELGASVSAGLLGAEAARSIRRGLGEPAIGVTAQLLSDTLTVVISQCLELNADQAFRAARRARDEIDASGIANRAEAKRERQFWRQYTKPDGMVRGEYELDPENGAFITDVYDQLMSPRLGGPRFVEAGKLAWAQALTQDPRGTQRIAAEALVELLRIGADADPGRVFGGNRPAVKVIVHQSTLAKRHGSGALEGHPDAIPLETVERHICEDGYVPIAFDDDGQCVNVGRASRLFTERQRLGLAVRDGGCLWPDCERPPSWTEAHHINSWAEKNGKTNIADGVSLCRRHHMLLHNRHWEIERRGSADYWLVPPPDLDSERSPRRLHSKSALNLQSPVKREGTALRSSAPVDSARG